MPTSKDNTISLGDCYRHFITDEIISLILIQSLNERDVIVNKNKYKLIFLNSLFRFFYFYVHNKMYIYMKENQHYIHIYYIHQQIYVHKIKNIGGKQQLNKCKINFVKKKKFISFCFLVLGRNLPKILQQFVLTKKELIIIH